MKRLIGRVARLGENRIAVAVERSGDDVAGRVAAIVLPDAPEGTADVTFQLASAGDSVTLCRNGGSAIAQGPAGVVAHVLLDEITHTLASACGPGLILHAAAVGSKGAAVLIPGSNGTGKSILATSLVRRGLTLLGDEIVQLSGDAMLRALPRPLVIKEAGLGLISTWIGAMPENSNVSLRTPLGMLLHPRMIGQADQTGLWRCGAVLFPVRQERSRVEYRALSGGETALRLMKSVVNGGSARDHGFADVVALARAAPGYELSYSEAEDVGIQSVVTW